MKRLVLIGLTAAFSITLGACSTFAPKVDMPEKTTVSQQVQQPAQVAMAAPTGSLYSPATYRPLFEDQRARFLGDTLTIQIIEQINAAQTNSMSASRSDSGFLWQPRFARHQRQCKQRQRFFWRGFQPRREYLDWVHYGHSCQRIAQWQFTGCG